MKTALLVAQIIVSVTLTTLILLQAKGVGLGRAWGGGGEFYKSRRGVEKFIFNLTIIFTVLLFAVSLVNLLVS